MSEDIHEKLRKRKRRVNSFKSELKVKIIVIGDLISQVSIRDKHLTIVMDNEIGSRL